MKRIHSLPTLVAAAISTAAISACTDYPPNQKEMPFDPQRQLSYICGNMSASECSAVQSAIDGLYVLGGDCEVLANAVQASFDNGEIYSDASRPGDWGWSAYPPGTASWIRLNPITFGDSRELGTTLAHEAAHLLGDYEAAATSRGEQCTQL